MKKLLCIGIVLLAITSLLFGVACASHSTVRGSESDIYATSTGYSNTGKIIVPTVTPTSMISGQSSGGYSSNGQLYDADIQRMIVRTSNMTLVVTDISSSLDKITKLAQDIQGYVVSSNQWKENGALLGTITIRVPAEQFNSAMSSLRAMADEVTSENTSSQDVTEEYTDLNAQLTNLEATQAQLLAIMNKATTVPDILAVQQQLTNTNGQIDSIKGRMKYLEQTSATSLITISLTQSKLDVKLTAGSSRDIRAGDSVEFNATVSGGFSPYNYKWDFGDKSTSTDESPVHTYNAAGKYTVTLTITDDKGNTMTDTRTDYITVQAGSTIGNVASTAWKGLISFGRFLVNVLVALGVWSPVWLIGGGIGYWIWRRRKMKKAQKANKV
jgi:hypothetical protein